jgi:hypothetical protein
MEILKFLIELLPGWTSVQCRRFKRLSAVRCFAFRTRGATRQKPRNTITHLPSLQLVLLWDGVGTFYPRRRGNAQSTHLRKLFFTEHSLFLDALKASIGPIHQHIIIIHSQDQRVD